MKTRTNFSRERVGVNHVRTIVENAGCFFKEVDLLYDVGHDASVVLVVDNHVHAKEIALQIKSGSSYVKSNQCRFPASSAHLDYWAKHDLLTLGVVYDPEEQVAYWVDLREESKARLRAPSGSGTSISFEKSAWNRFDRDQFSSILVPLLLGEAPLLSLDTACEWLNSAEMSTHHLGLRILCARHRQSIWTWQSIIGAFRARPLDALTAATPIAIARMLGHDDVGFHDIPQSVRGDAVALALDFGPDEIAKALALVEDSDFERPSLGYSMMPLWGMTVRSPQILASIMGSVRFDGEVRRRAAGLLGWYRNEPEWWRFWLRDGSDKTDRPSL
ncbi:conserved hypothetical protein [Mesorhizobium delmotii]|uniref:DUF4365 domain-containing protein n=2 Tax=Mesorhizobium delmotii TaxID=1631247 RepID=A0A2P9AB09_9HYPH|nr:conserved hypothetical protein [Mesorhizobium delmotii]